MNTASKFRAIWLVVAIFAAILVTVTILSLNTSAEFEGGSGTPEDPYQIATVDMNNMLLVWQVALPTAATTSNG